MRKRGRKGAFGLTVGVVGLVACSGASNDVGSAAPSTTAAVVATTTSTSTTLPPEFTFTGKITLFSDDDGVSASESGACEGIGGYDDVGSLTPVKVLTFDEQILARESLGVGTLMTLDEVLAFVIEMDILDEVSYGLGERGIKNGYETGVFRWCTFSFDFTLPEGADGGGGYLVTVGERGEVFLSEEELKVPGAINLSLGAP